MSCKYSKQLKVLEYKNSSAEVQALSNYKISIIKLTIDLTA